MSSHIDPAKEKAGGWEILKKADKDDCCYQKVILKDNKLKGAILFGDNRALSYVNSKMEEDVNKEELRELLELYVYICNNCGSEYDESKTGVPFEDLPDDFKCPNCKGAKNQFKKKEWGEIFMEIHRCKRCNYVYVDEEQEIPFEKLGNDYKCPRCRSSTKFFVKKELPK